MCPVNRVLLLYAGRDLARRLIATKREIDRNPAVSYSSRHPDDLVWTTSDYVGLGPTTDVIVTWNRELALGMIETNSRPEIKKSTVHGEKG